MTTFKERVAALNEALRNITNDLHGDTTTLTYVEIVLLREALAADIDRDALALVVHELVLQDAINAVYT